MQLKLLASHLPAALQPFESTLDNLTAFSETLHSGMLCPVCSQGKLDYDGLLNLTCPVCGFQSGSGGGCT